MRVICSYCGILYDLKEPLEDDSISHGACPECWPWVKHNLEIEIAQTGESQNLKVPMPEDDMRLRPASNEKVKAFKTGAKVLVNP